MPKKALFVIAQNGFRDEELLETKAVLESRGIQTTVASQQKGVAVGKLGTQVNADMSVYDANAIDYDAIIFPGGPGAVTYFNDERIWELVREFYKEKKFMAAICIAPSILANAGLFMGKKVTAYCSEEENLKNRGAEYTGMSVEVDDHIITARDFFAANEFGDKIAWHLEA